MPVLSHEAMILKAASVIRPRRVGDYTVGDVGCALVTADTHLYLGVSIDAGSGIGFCAEHSAVAAMVTAGEFRIRKIVAVWRNGEGLHVLAPCGRCRELMRQMHEDNIHAEVVLDEERSATLEDLLPMAGWFRRTSLRPE